MKPTLPSYVNDEDPELDKNLVALHFIAPKQSHAHPNIDKLQDIWFPAFLEQTVCRPKARVTDFSQERMINFV